MSNAALADVCSALEFVVLERLEGGFVRMGDYPLPPWFVRVFIQAQNEGSTLTLTDVFPVLDSFLSEADQFWDRRRRRPALERSRSWPPTRSARSWRLSPRP